MTVGRDLDVALSGLYDIGGIDICFGRDLGFLHSVQFRNRSKTSIAESGPNSRYVSASSTHAPGVSLLQDTSERSLSERLCCRWKNGL